jgi:hypothetical protein
MKVDTLVDQIVSNVSKSDMIDDHGSSRLNPAYDVVVWVGARKLVVTDVMFDHRFKQFVISTGKQVRK